MKSHRKAVASLLLIPATLFANGCMHAAPKSASALADSPSLHVEGELTQGMFGCLTVRTADGKHYSLARDLDGSRPGQHIWVDGVVVKTKGCMPGVTLMPQKAGLLGTEVAATTQVAGSGIR